MFSVADLTMARYHPGCFYRSIALSSCSQLKIRIPYWNNKCFSELMGSPVYRANGGLAGRHGIPTKEFPISGGELLMI